MWEDPIVAEVHQIREQLAAQFNFDVKAIFADMRRRQYAHGDRLISQTSTTSAPINAKDSPQAQSGPV